MARIKTYVEDLDLRRGDKWIGTDEQSDGTTKNYTLGAVADFIVDSSTGNVVVNSPDEEDIEAPAGLLKFKDRDASGSQRGYKIIRVGFDWDNIPASFADSDWEIQTVFDLLGSAVLLPNNVTLRFTGGKITNYASITAGNGRSDVTEAEGFDGSGTIDASWIFGDFFNTDDRILLETPSNLAYVTDVVGGAITITTGDPVLLPAATELNAGLLTVARFNEIDSLILPGYVYVPEASQGVITAPPSLGPNIIIPLASGGNAGLMTDAQGITVDNSVNAELAYTPNVALGLITNTAGTDATIPAVDNTNAGLMTPALKATVDSSVTILKQGSISINSILTPIAGSITIFGDITSFLGLNPITDGLEVTINFSTIGASNYHILLNTSGSGVIATSSSISASTFKLTLLSYDGSDVTFFETKIMLLPISY